jgi:transcriptional regulator with XRE-family HTH domain
MWSSPSVANRGADATLQVVPPDHDSAERKGDEMPQGAEDSRPVENSDENDVSQGAENFTRGAALKRRREAAGISGVELERETGLARQTIARAEKGHGSKATYRTLEAWFDHFDEETGADAPDRNGGLIEFELEGDFGVRAVIRGPIADAEAVEQAAARFVDRIRARRATDESSEGEREPK